MNNFGDFLYSLRKEKGMTQNELATILGVTNKAVSKWETGDSMPETSLLVPLSQIFGVTVDELLKGERADRSDDGVKTDEPDNKDDDKPVNIKDYMFTRGKDDGAPDATDKKRGAICTVLFFAVIITYLILGVTLNLWHPCWVLIPAGALTCGIIGVIADLCNKQKRAKKRERGENPIVGAICGIVMLLSIIAYLLLGALWNLWHPYWIILVAGAAVCGITGAIGKAADCSKNK